MGCRGSRLRFVVKGRRGDLEAVPEARLWLVVRNEADEVEQDADVEAEVERVETSQVDSIGGAGE